LKRFPDGVYGDFFYEKDAPAFTPAWVKTVSVPRKNKAEPDIRYILINNMATLVWLANLANLEIHPFLHRSPNLDRPTSMVFDCDPGEGADVLTCARVALMPRDLLQELELASFPKVSGSKGLQVYVPFNSAVTYEVTQPLARAVAELLEEREPKLVVSRMPKVFRAKKVFIDWSQNAEFKTTVGVYSLRAKVHRPYVSMPVEWDELSTAIKKEKTDLLYFKPDPQHHSVSPTEFLALVSGYSPRISSVGGNWGSLSICPFYWPVCTFTHDFNFTQVLIGNRVRLPSLGQLALLQIWTRQASPWRLAERHFPDFPPLPYLRLRIGAITLNGMCATVTASFIYHLFDPQTHMTLCGLGVNHLPADTRVRFAGLHKVSEPAANTTLCQTCAGIKG
jgi:bifunctional non-homologous end joining protein LigD